LQPALDVVNASQHLPEEEHREIAEGEVSRILAGESPTPNAEIANARSEATSPISKPVEDANRVEKPKNHKPKDVSTRDKIMNDAANPKYKDWVPKEKPKEDKKKNSGNEGKPKASAHTKEVAHEIRRVLEGKPVPKGHAKKSA
jgi:hypothetical protein